MKTASAMPGFETNVSLFAKKISSTRQLCGVSADYYTKYSDISCNRQANELIVEHQSAGIDLWLCGFGILAQCNCAQTSFDTALFTNPTPFASATSLSIQSTSSLQTIYFNRNQPDTISSVCGNADGITTCGPRASLYFKDKLTGLKVLTWPYLGYNYDGQSTLTLDPAQAYEASVLTAIIGLQNYAAVIFSQDITVVVKGGKTKSGYTTTTSTTSVDGVLTVAST